MGKSKLLKGTFILTISAYLSKILGIIYVIPFTAMVGTQGYILFEYAYKPYAIILSIATMGIPAAVSKIISKYNETGDYQTGRRLLKWGIGFMTITGLISFLALYLSAPWIAGSLVNENDTTGNSLNDIVYVIRMVSFALLIVPLMAVIRGFFQGYQSMEPTGVSQVIEQLVRVLFILGGSLVVIFIFKGTVTTAVGLATFGAFVGAIGGLAVLWYYWKKKKVDLDEKLNSSLDLPLKSMKDIGKEVMIYAVPFVLIGLAIPFYQTLDTFMINKALMSVDYTQKEAETVNSVVSLVQKIIWIPISLATAFSLTLIPAITSSFVGKHISKMHEQISQTYRMILFITLPATVGLMVLGDSAYYAMFGSLESEMGGQLMVWYAPMALFFSLFMVTSSMLQGMDKQKMVVGSMVIGLLIKAMINNPFIMEFEAAGTAIATYIGLSVSILLNAIMIKKFGLFTHSSLMKPVGKSILSVIIMAGAVLLVDIIIQHMFSISSIYLMQVLRLVIGMAIGVVVYFGSSYVLKNEEELMNRIISMVRRKMKR